MELLVVEGQCLPPDGDSSLSPMSMFTTKGGWHHLVVANGWRLVNILECGKSIHTCGSCDQGWVKVSLQYDDFMIIVFLKTEIVIYVLCNFIVVDQLVIFHRIILLIAYTIPVKFTIFTELFSNCLFLRVCYRFIDPKDRYQTGVSTSLICWNKPGCPAKADKVTLLFLQMRREITPIFHKTSLCKLSFLTVMELVFKRIIYI